MNTPVTDSQTPPVPTPVPFPQATPPVPSMPVVSEASVSPTQFPGVSAATTTTTTTSTSSSSSNSASSTPPRKKTPWTMLVGVVAFMFLVVGGGAAIYLSQTEQDTRNQAAEGDQTVTCGNTCTTNAQCSSGESCNAGKCAFNYCLDTADTRSQYCFTNKCGWAQPGANSSTTSACVLPFTVEENPAPVLTCVKMAYQDEFSNTPGNYSYTTPKTAFETGDVIVYRIDVSRNAEMTQTISLTDVLKEVASGANTPGLNMEFVTFMDSTCGANAYNATTNTLTCTLSAADDVLTKTIGFRVKLDDTIPSNSTATYNLNNIATVTAGQLSDTCQTNVTFTQPPAYLCGSDCSLNSHCPNDHMCSSNGKCVLTACTVPGAACTVNQCAVNTCGSTCTADDQCPNDHSCNAGTCKLDACLVSGATCSTNKCVLVVPTPTATPTVTPTATPTVTPTATPTVTPTATPTVVPSPTLAPVVCGSNCTSTSQCPNDHTCNAGICKLTACVNGASCTADQCRVTACGGSCTTTAECPNDHTCNGGTCKLTACTTGSPCSTDQCRVTACGSSCSANADCPNDHTCSSGVCRLTACVNGSKTCTNNQCTTLTVITENPTPTAVPLAAVGCNNSCATNADCSASSHICVDTASGRRCRLETNITSDSCSAPGQVVTNTTTPPTYTTTNTTTPTATATPTTALPTAGSTDILKAIGVGAFALILGAVGVLLM